MKLSNRQLVFVEEYLTCWNASEAARRAGYTGKPDVIGARLLGNVSIKERVERRIAEKAMGADEVLLRLAEQARANITDFIEPEPKAVTIGRGDDADTIMIDSASLDWEALRKRGHLVKRISFNQYGPVIEMVDGQAALVNLGRHFKLFTYKVEQETKVNIIWDLPTSE
jgi:hypothetical protein